MHLLNCFIMLRFTEIRLHIELSHPEQPLLKAKQLFCLRNLLHNRQLESTG